MGVCTAILSRDAAMHLWGHKDYGTKFSIGKTAMFDEDEDTHLIEIHGPAVPEGGSMMRQVAFQPDGSVAFPSDLDT